jgi:hypothetical protein
MSKKTLLILGTSGVLALGIAAPTVAWAENRNNQSISHPGGEERQSRRLSSVPARATRRRW